MLKKEQDRLIVEKAQLWENKVCLEKVVSVACQQVPENTEEMDAEAKAEWLGAVIRQLKHGNDDLHALVNPGTPPVKAAERKTTIKDLAT